MDDDFRELMRRVQEGSQDAAWELVRVYGESIRNAVRRVLDQRLRSKFDSLDFVQIVWKSFFEARNGLERFGSPAELAAFLAGAARNKVLMESRRRKTYKKYNVLRERPLDACDDSPAMNVPDRKPTPLQVAIAHERWNQLLQGQPEQYRQIVQMKLQGETCVAIGKALDLDERTVRNFLKRLLRSAAV
jgi:RNA polymerase sigma factor (sigma-70 family)